MIEQPHQVLCRIDLAGKEALMPVARADAEAGGCEAHERCMWSCRKGCWMYIARLSST